MADAIGEILPLGIAVAATPLGIIAVILLLFSPRGLSKGVAFLVGWMLALAAVGALALALGQAGSGETMRLSPALKLALGAGLLWLALRLWRTRRAPGEPAPTPGWMKTLESYTPVSALTFAFVFGGLKPKNLLLTLAAALAISEQGLSGSQPWIAMAVYVLLGSLTLAGPVLYYIAGGAKARASLGGLKEWLVVNNNTVMGVVLVIFGVMMIGDALGRLL